MIPRCQRQRWCLSWFSFATKAIAAWSTSILRKYASIFGTCFLRLSHITMKGALVSVSDSLPTRKRSIIETINDEPNNIAQTEHSRHRCFDNFIGQPTVHWLHIVALWRSHALKCKEFVTNSNSRLKRFVLSTKCLLHWDRLSRRKKGLLFLLFRVWVSNVVVSIVPKGSKKEYRQAFGWRKFKHIIEYWVGNPPELTSACRNSSWITCFVLKRLRQDGMLFVTDGFALSAKNRQTS